MLSYQGIGASSGLARGPLCFINKSDSVPRPEKTNNPSASWQDFLTAREEACRELAELSQKSFDEGNDDIALLFEAHQELAKDPDWEDCVKGLILEEGFAAPYAVYAAGEQFAALLEAVVEARGTDMRDIAGRIIGRLTGQGQATRLSCPSVLVAEDLTPSETASLDKRAILGFVTEKGSATGHTAILARILGIPAVIGVGKLPASLAGHAALLDGDAGTLCIDPDEEVLRDFSEKSDTLRKERENLADFLKPETIAPDGRRIGLYCNISSPEDMEKVLQNGGEGIGLYRSEFLYLGRSTPPSEEEMLEAYRRVLEAMPGRPVIIRTLDIGADKQVDYLGLDKEENPAMGARAIRLCLERPELFRIQLRALYRASVYGRLKVMLPMITSVWEIQEVKKLCEEIQAELKQEGLPFAESVPLGIMIETPAAALISRELACEVDFFSIGTNDLTQYLLACDRQNPRLEKVYDPHHPALLLLLKTVTENAHAAGIPVGICGELAADSSMKDFFLDIGIDELSVSPAALLPLRRAICTGFSVK